MTHLKLIDPEPECEACASQPWACPEHSKASFNLATFLRAARRIAGEPHLRRVK